MVLNGVAGTVVYARLNKTHSKHAWCDLTADWYRVWINAEELAPLVIDCLCENMAITFDPTTKTYSNSPGVFINATSDFGGFDAMMYLDPDVLHLVPYMAGLVKYFTGLGYTVGRDLYGAPYDWRLCADAQQQYFSRLQSLIELAVQTNNAPALLVGHSMGGLMSLKFLQSMSADWKAAHIKTFVPVDAPWGGSMNALMGVISGYNFGIPAIPHDWFRDLQTSTPSMGWFQPVPGLGYDGTFAADRVLVSTPTRNYTAFQLEQLLQDEGLTAFLAMYRQVSPLLLGDGFAAPGVDVYVIYGFNVTTHCGLQYDRAFVPGVEPPAPRSMFWNCTGDGDGTVNINSLQRATLTWPSDPRQQGFVLNTTRIPNMEHMSAIYDPRVLQLLGQLAAQ